MPAFVKGGAMLSPKARLGNCGTSGVAERLFDPEAFLRLSPQAAPTSEPKIRGSPQCARRGAKCFLCVSTFIPYNTVHWALLFQLQ